MAFCSAHIRCISTSATTFGKRNFRKFNVYGKRGTRAFKERMHKDPHEDLKWLYDRGVRQVHLKTSGRIGPPIPEMIPELIVPDLEGFKLKPYVSYKVPDVIQSEFTPQDLFYAVYSNKIAEDFKNNKLDADGNSLEPSPEELITPEEAIARTKSTGSDIYSSFRDNTADHKST